MAVWTHSEAQTTQDRQNKKTLCNVFIGMAEAKSSQAFLKEILGNLRDGLGEAAVRLLENWRV